MNCFDWYNHSSEYLDGTLSESLKRQADEHLENCKSCTDRTKHYRIILASIVGLPKNILPPTLKKAPLSATLPRADTFRYSLTQWERVPWYIRTALEAFGIVVITLVVITLAPRLRSAYEKHVEKNLTELKEDLTPLLSESELTNAGNPGGSDSHLPLMTTQQDEAHPSADVAGEEDDSEDADMDSVHVGKSELWRFTLKTVSPDEFRPQVIQALRALEIPLNTPGLGGTQVPGGIEFDMALPTSIVPQIKHALEKLKGKLNPLTAANGANGSNGVTNANGAAEEPSSESNYFSWYKVKSKKRLPAGKAQVVIWLAQPN